MAVNGPPGTGKTTLLRDIVAAAVFDRAVAMAHFSNPEDAFKASGARFPAGDKAFFHLYKLDPRLKGHEIVVASSNNKAVENVSRELPETKAVGCNLDALSYFRAVSDNLHNRTIEAEQDEEDQPSTETEPVQTWGLIAAVLGNARNRGAFQRKFWWDEEFGFRLYLKAAKGDSVVREIKDANGKLIERRPPFIIEAENPPTPQMAQSKWRRTRETFLKLKRDVENDIKAVEEIRQRCVRLRDIQTKLAEIEAILAQYRQRYDPLSDQYLAAKAQLAQAREDKAQHSERVRLYKAKRPGFFARLFRFASWREWSAKNDILLIYLKQAKDVTQEVEQKAEQIARPIIALQTEINAAESQWAAEGAKATDLREAIDKHRLELGGRLVDEAFFGQGHEASNLSAPWLPDSLHQKREALFVAAMNVHRAFIDASAQKILHNLSILMDVFSGGPPSDPTKLGLLPELWSTLFLVVPVMSTTFASVERMFGDLPPDSLGWLLIDEAGQALPQAAVGAMMRTRRTIVVGDPLQIPPIVSLPDRLTAGICDFFRIERSIWAAPDASAQTLADSASRFQGAFEGGRIVGVPLLVHRRCQEPMFSISNDIAYDGQMVHAPPPPNAGAVGQVLGPSAWFDVDGEADSKWCPAEGEVIVNALKALAVCGVQKPDVFIISPFRIVAFELRRRLAAESELFEAFGLNVRDWVKDRVGTIHTVQGREALSVMLVLGAPKASQGGARHWASNTPNIFNVAVSRAKQNLYVIGSYGAWSGVGHAREIAKALPRKVEIF